MRVGVDIGGLGASGGGEDGDGNGVMNERMPCGEVGSWEDVGYTTPHDRTPPPQPL